MADGVIELIVTIVEDYAREIRKRENEVAGIYLYGSYAKGVSSSDSDIDVAIVIDRKEVDVFDEQLKYMRYRRKIDTRIEPHIFIKDELSSDIFWGSIKNQLIKIA
ncbi:MAG: hypothetical protein A2Y24_01935 [Clostridiales bacterium GWE2_32_10]|nr:MAG: hypothetical protein A2Y24_01935 [Clostridiales bacterium GWE2_32_10]